MLLIMLIKWPYHIRNIKFSLSNNGKVLLNTDGRNNLLKVINELWFRSNQKMIEIM